jgi:hypothetical protein
VFEKAYEFSRLKQSLSCTELNSKNISVRVPIPWASFLVGLRRSFAGFLLKSEESRAKQLFRRFSQRGHSRNPKVKMIEVKII